MYLDHIIRSKQVRVRPIIVISSIMSNKNWIDFFTVLLHASPLGNNYSLGYFVSNKNPEDSAASVDSAREKARDFPGEFRLI